MIGRMIRRWLDAHRDYPSEHVHRELRVLLIPNLSGWDPTMHLGDEYHRFLHCDVCGWVQRL